MLFKQNKFLFEKYKKFSSLPQKELMNLLKKNPEGSYRLIEMLIYKIHGEYIEASNNNRIKKHVSLANKEKNSEMVRVHLFRAIAVGLRLLNMYEKEDLHLKEINRMKKIISGEVKSPK